MEVVANVICISRDKTLQVDNVASLVSAFDSLNLCRACNLHTFIIRLVNHLVDFKAQRLRHFEHLLVEAFTCNDRFFVIDGSIFGQTTQVVIVEDTGND